MTIKDVQTPRPDYYPDLHGANYYNVADNVLVFVKDGIVTVSNPTTMQFVQVSEWDMGGFVEAWLRDRGAQARQSHKQ